MGRVPASERLARLALALRPEKAPYYVWLPPAGLEDQFPAPGWYWVPQGHPYAVYLGANELNAALELRRLMDRELAADA